MTTSTRERSHRLADSVAYRLQWIALSMFGPAQLGDDEDPLERLRRRYGRPSRPPDVAHPMGLQRSYERLPR